ncbi:hypothetical protein [Chryseobacterium gallinarum]|uniref:Uncharacterized protein n=1 Tax=Chryseobacterium gallinarum TaxID=1324352 RepID=A0ABX6KUX9_CHRGL|nr:hypothetical protein [Chryseobacterium gallinarum]QIY92406.1 hypothetical protein FOB44_17875 [Chryseobacterium gallinarum]
MSINETSNYFSSEHLYQDGLILIQECFCLDAQGTSKNGTVKARTFEFVKDKKTYYYETLGSQFISAGLKTK